jgi:hypothetical protein
VVRKLWIEGEVPREAIDAALERHAEGCGVRKVKGRIGAR